MSAKSSRTPNAIRSQSTRLTTTDTKHASVDRGGHTTDVTQYLTLVDSEYSIIGKVSYITCVVHLSFNHYQ